MNVYVVPIIFGVAAWFTVFALSKNLYRVRLEVHDSGSLKRIMVANTTIELLVMIAPILSIVRWAGREKASALCVYAGTILVVSMASSFVDFQNRVKKIYKSAYDNIVTGVKQYYPDFTSTPALEKETIKLFKKLEKLDAEDEKESIKKIKEQIYDSIYEHIPSLHVTARD